VITEFLPEADLEFRQAVLYFEEEAPGVEEEAPGVGMSFIAEVHRAVSLIVQNPHAAAAVGSGIRLKVLDHSPSTSSTPLRAS
jgi:hypothetical protein